MVEMNNWRHDIMNWIVKLNGVGIGCDRLDSLIA